MDRLDALRLFVRTVETGSFTRAGIELNLSQPQASRAIAALERRLGAQLLLRSTRRLMPTEAGQRAYDQALRLLAEETGLMEAIAGADREPAGMLRISASVVFSEAEIVPNVAAFLNIYPRIRLDILATDARTDLVAEGVDLAFRLGRLDDSSMTARRLGQYERWLVAAPDVAAAVEGHDDLAAALRDRGIAFSGTSLGRRWSLLRGHAKLDIEMNGRLASSNGAVVQRLALFGQGVALLPTFAVFTDVEAGRLVRIAPEWSGAPIDVHALWSGRSLPGKARVFLDHLASRLAIARATSGEATSMLAQDGPRA